MLCNFLKKFISVVLLFVFTINISGANSLYSLAAPSPFEVVASPSVYETFRLDNNKTRDNGFSDKREQEDSTSTIGQRVFSWLMASFPHSFVQTFLIVMMLWILGGCNSRYTMVGSNVGDIEYYRTHRYEQLRWIWGLENLNDQMALDRLVNYEGVAINDMGSETVREVSLEMVGKIGGPGAIIALMKEGVGIHDPSLDNRIIAIKLLGNLVNDQITNGQKKRVIEALIQVAIHDRWQYCRKCAVISIVKIDRKRAIEIFNQEGIGAKDPDYGVRAETIRQIMRDEESDRILFQEGFGIKYFLVSRSIVVEHSNAFYRFHNCRAFLRQFIHLF